MPDTIQIEPADGGVNTRENGRFEIRGHIRHVIRLRERLPQEAAQFAICCPAGTWADLEEESEEGRKALARDVEEDSRKKTRFSNCQFYPISVSPLAEPDGTLTLPQAVREKAGLKEGDQLAVEITPDGILLKPLSGSPIEIYTEARAAEFKAADDELRGYRFK